MGKSLYFRVVFYTYWTALAVCVPARLYLKLWGTDRETGFYFGPALLVGVLNYVLLAAVALLFLLNRLKVSDNDYPIVRQCRVVGISSLLTGAAAALFTLESTGWLRITPRAGLTLQGIGLVAVGVLGLLSAAAFITVGLTAFPSVNRKANALLSLCPALWTLALLVSKFNHYITVSTIADNLFAVLFMVFAAMFMIGYARTICGLSRKDGRNYIIPTGLTAALAGFLLAVPNFAHMLMYPGVVPAPAIGDMEMLFVFLFSVYAAAAVVNFRRSIATV